MRVGEHVCPRARARTRARACVAWVRLRARVRERGCVYMRVGKKEDGALYIRG